MKKRYQAVLAMICAMALLFASVPGSLSEAGEELIAEIQAETEVPEENGMILGAEDAVTPEPADPAAEMTAALQTEETSARQTEAMAADPAACAETEKMENKQEPVPGASEVPADVESPESQLPEGNAGEITDGSTEAPAGEPSNGDQTEPEPAKETEVLSETAAEGTEMPAEAGEPATGEAPEGGTPVQPEDTEVPTELPEMTEAAEAETDTGTPAMDLGEANEEAEATSEPSEEVQEENPPRVTVGQTAEIHLSTEKQKLLVSARKAGRVRLTMENIPGLTVLLGGTRLNVNPAEQEPAPEWISFDMEVAAGENEVFLCAAESAVAHVKTEWIGEASTDTAAVVPQEMVTPEEEAAAEPTEEIPEETAPVAGTEEAKSPALEAGEAEEARQPDAEQTDPTESVESEAQETEANPESETEADAQAETISAAEPEEDGEPSADGMKALEPGAEEQTDAPSEPTREAEPEEEAGNPEVLNNGEEVPEEPEEEPEEAKNAYPDFIQERLDQGYVRVMVIRENGTQVYDGTNDHAEAVRQLELGDVVWARPVGGIWAELYRDGEDEAPAYFNLNNVVLQVGELDCEIPIPRVKLSSTLDEMTEIEEGTAVTLTAEISGFTEDEILEITWQYRPEDAEEEDFREVEDAHGLTYTYDISAENLHAEWRIILTLQS